MCSSVCPRTLSTLLVLCAFLGFSPLCQSQPAGNGAQDSRAESTTTIPGPIRPFLRMAGISQKASSDQILPLMARNVYMLGYAGTTGKRPTEFLVLLERYVGQARELSALAGRDGVIRVTDCAGAQPLLRVLGYRVRPECGKENAVLITDDADRAFITIDSGFPLSDLEESLQSGKAFAYSFGSSRVPLLFGESDWTSITAENGKPPSDILDVLLQSPSVARLYWALSRMDGQTAAALRQRPGLKGLLPVAAVLDFYGSYICIRSGRVLVPGGSAAESEWKALAGVNPDSPNDFILHLLAKDRGWMAAYFDALARLREDQQRYFAQAPRLRRFYEAFHAADPNEESARSTFRPAPSILLLLTRMRWEPDGEPHVPGNLPVWSQILRQKSESKVVREWGKRSSHLNSPDQLLEAMFAFSRLSTSSSPLQAYLALSEIDGQRPSGQQLGPKTVLLMCSKFADLSDQYRIFAEFPELDDAAITQFIETAGSLNSIQPHSVRGNAMGIFQANVGLWQILARQEEIPRDQRTESWQQVIHPFAGVRTSTQAFDAGQISLSALARAAGAKASASQDEIIALLAGPSQTNSEGQRVREQQAKRIRAILDDQRLVSLDTILALGTGLKEQAQGKAPEDWMISLAGELREFEMPRPIFSGSERTQWAAGVYNNRHTDLEMKSDLAKIIKSPHSGEQLEEARGQLTPFLRDTLVALNYAYYEPPGAQILHNNPLFVRSHDFSGDTVSGIDRVWQAPQLFGEGSPAGGGARLVGSLADLPFVLAETEQDFISPQNVQALIWRDLVPGLLISATLPRWWNVSSEELHAVALYQKAGEELLLGSVNDKELHSKVMAILSDRMTPQLAERIDQASTPDRMSQVLRELTPADRFYLTAEFRRRFPDSSPEISPANHELDILYKREGSKLSWEKLSQDFGVPHPILAQSYGTRLLSMKPFPSLSGYSSRLLAETWDSTNLYWARLTDEMGYSPVVLNSLVPELTRSMVEKIFASNLEDWPAILRAMRETGDDFRQGKLGSTEVRSAALQ